MGKKKIWMTTTQQHAAAVAATSACCLGPSTIYSSNKNAMISSGFIRFKSSELNVSRLLMFLSDWNTLMEQIKFTWSTITTESFLRGELRRQKPQRPERSVASHTRRRRRWRFVGLFHKTAHPSSPMISWRRRRRRMTSQGVVGTDLWCGGEKDWEDHTVYLIIKMKCCH